MQELQYMAAKKKAVKKKAVKKTVKAKATTKKKTTSKKKVAAKKSAKKAVKKAAPKVKAKTAKKKVVKKAAPKAKAKAKPAPKPKKSKPATRPVKKTTRSGDDLDYTDFTPYEMKKGEDYMNAEQVDHFYELLNSWKAELMEKVDETVHHMQDEAANFPDPNDRATQESDFTMELRTRDRERKLIKKIDESINLLDNDEYGYCESCGIEIGVRRLEARPTATECIDCKTLNEIKEKQFGK